VFGDGTRLTYLNPPLSYYYFWFPKTRRWRDLLLELWDLLHISGPVGDKNFKFGMHINNNEDALGRCFFEPPMRLRGWSGGTVLQIQNGVRRHVRFSINSNNFGVNCHTLTKFGGSKRAACQSGVWSQRKPEVKFPNGGRLFSETESSNNSAVD